MPDHGMDTKDHTMATSTILKKYSQYMHPQQLLIEVTHLQDVAHVGYVPTSYSVQFSQYTPEMELLRLFSYQLIHS